MEKEMENTNETKVDISFDVRLSTVFYEQWYQIMKNFPMKERDKAYKYIFEYAFYGIEPDEPERDKTPPMSYVVFGMAKPNIDSAQRRYDSATENGQKGGRPKKVTEEIREKIIKLRKNGMTQKDVAIELGLSLKTIQRVEKDISQNHNVNVNVNDNDNSVASDEDYTELANAQTDGTKVPKSSYDGNQLEEFDFKSKRKSLSNNSIRHVIDIKFDEVNVDGHSPESIINYMVKELTGASYQCDKDAVIDYVSRKFSA